MESHSNERNADADRMLSSMNSWNEYSFIA